MDLQGRTAIVTGGGGGLGSATARRLAEVGMNVVVFDWVADKAEAVADELSGAGAKAVAVSGDASDDDAVAAAIDAATKFGPIFLLANIAGGGVPGGGRTLNRDGSPHAKDPFVKTIEMNVVATFNMTRLVASSMSTNEPDSEGQRGVIVNTGSLAGLEGQAGQLGYGTAKAAILGMTLPLTRDLAPVGIRVCAIAPGTMGTPVMLGVRDEVKAKLEEGIQFPKRMGKPEEFAWLVESIARNTYLNGENIRLDGGLRFPPK